VNSTHETRVDHGHSTSLDSAAVALIVICSALGFALVVMASWYWRAELQSAAKSVTTGLGASNDKARAPEAVEVEATKSIELRIVNL
jgi:hypothetical protein